MWTAVTRFYPTAPLASVSLIVAYAVVAATGSRPLGGLVLAAGGLTCLRLWSVRHGRRMAVRLGAVGLAAFVLSHLLALALGPWPAVLLTAVAVGGVVWREADSLL